MNNDKTDINEKRISPTVESLKDIESSTCCIDSYKGRPTFAINKESQYPFSFGMLKAKLLVKHMKSLVKFVETEGKSIT